MKTLSGFILTDLNCIHCEAIWVYDKVFLSLVSAEIIHTSNGHPNRETEREKESESESERKKNKERVKQRVNKFY